MKNRLCTPSECKNHFKSSSIKTFNIYNEQRILFLDGSTFCIKFAQKYHKLEVNC